MDNKRQQQFGVLVVGPSGSGKSSLCSGLSQFLEQIGRKHCLVNLDPACDNLLYSPQIDIRDLVQLEEVMQTTQLGPNGALVYVIALLNNNIQWLIQALSTYTSHYFIFDLPGQIELYVNNKDFTSILSSLTKQIQLASVSLFECTHCYQPDAYSASCIYSLGIMVNLALPHLNVLSKLDLLSQYGRLPEQLSFYLEADEVGLLYNGQPPVTVLDHRRQALHKALAQVTTNYNLNSFIPLMVDNKKSICYLLSFIDKANGYYYKQGQGEEQFRDLRQKVFELDNISPTEMYSELEEMLFGFQEQEDNWEKDLEEIRQQQLEKKLQKEQQEQEQQNEQQEQKQQKELNELQKKL